MPVREAVWPATETETLRVVDDSAHTLPQADPVAVDRRLVDAAGTTARPWLVLRVVALLNEVLLRPFTLRRDMGEDVHPSDADCERRNRRGDRPPAPPDESEHDKSGGERKE